MSEFEYTIDCEHCGTCHEIRVDDGECPENELVIALKKLEIALEALSFYADEWTYETEWTKNNPENRYAASEWTGNELVLEDLGVKARQALKEINEEIGGYK